MGLFDFLKHKNPAVVVDSDESCYHEAMKALKRCDLRGAYKIICRWNVDSGKPGLGFDWEEELEQGLSEETKDLLQYFYTMDADREMLHNAVFCELSGMSPHKTSKWACPDKEKQNEVYLDIYNMCSRYATLRDIEGLVRDGCDKVAFLATLDDKTCPVCGNMDGKVVKIKGSIIGKNLPPLHRGCRCTTVPYYDDNDMEGETRVARDPVTGKTVEVPATMTWKKWKKLNG
ncbi:minor capsid protein [Hungatella sp. SL.1.14]|uniref:minor capsid protein n=1 Tax=Hungatella sp. SL.1.14 TaxID=2963703 RepID=UPI00210BF443|nr:minor capsid protein [Hungatella sp. SL.1.14]MCQ4832951.1 minor capsid protein [Hungatella sp. SL.1.14]